MSAYRAGQARLSQTARAILRREQVGMLLQNAHLFPLLTAQENVEIPLRLARTSPVSVPTVRGRRWRWSPWAHAHQPRFVGADEPTGNLDSLTGQEIAALLRTLAHEQGIGMLIATHDTAVVDVADRVLVIADGVLV